MPTIPFRDRLAVCSWSLQPSGPEDLLAKLGTIGIRRIQLALDPLRENPGLWASLGPSLAAQGYEIVSGMIGFVGEDYTSMESIRVTGGVTPDETWEQNWANVQSSAALAQTLGLRLVTFHAGFIPHQATDPLYQKLLHRLRRIAGAFAARDIEVAFETGQETGPELHEFLLALNCPNVGVNFDPANIILYDNGNPLEALRSLAGWLKQVHIKDGVRTRTPGTWGEEVPAGEGEVPWSEFFKTLQELNYSGACCIEREAGQSRVEEIQAARRLVERLGV